MFYYWGVAALLGAFTQDRAIHTGVPGMKKVERQPKGPTTPKVVCAKPPRCMMVLLAARPSLAGRWGACRSSFLGGNPCFVRTSKKTR